MNKSVLPMLVLAGLLAMIALECFARFNPSQPRGGSKSQSSVASAFARR